MAKRVACPGALGNPSKLFRPRPFCFPRHFKSDGRARARFAGHGTRAADFRQASLHVAQAVGQCVVRRGGEALPVVSNFQLQPAVRELDPQENFRGVRVLRHIVQRFFHRQKQAVAHFAGKLALRQRSGKIINGPGNSVGLFMILAIQYSHLARTGTVFWTDGWLYVNLLLGVIPMMFILPYYNRVYFRMTGKVWLGPLVTCLIFIMMMLTNNVCYIPLK